MQHWRGRKRLLHHCGFPRLGTSHDVVRRLEAKFRRLKTIRICPLDVLRTLHNRQRDNHSVSEANYALNSTCTPRGCRMSEHERTHVSSSSLFFLSGRSSTVSMTRRIQQPNDPRFSFSYLFSTSRWCLSHSLPPQKVTTRDGNGAGTGCSFLFGRNSPQKRISRRFLSIDAQLSQTTK